ncbi:hypothetical protein CJO81_15085 [Ralstonia solanacearum]|uniref:DEAD/DEAH box helicase family protein n=1 Tax=Ralstonia pseudosolanacearum TaxID=1310165 RepID=UPI00035B53FF|nr:DEAD/DEAH box helicase family protein [Ralstonia pseudosolanacearum]AXV96754.1 hypothetical protein CJO80_14995 [Ralstonia solanacearum]ESS51455.1 P-loop containing nucleoside triphosphate hydrolase [Ralstonia solanacearum SD54]AXW01970.1 hypothetical protein CJO81_15085 [Ralstonia solanacearum]AXW29449.1 hypothetical protein CJO87_15085 [Ralstonia solanacearum]MCK4130202.1 DEAD/DEAH box helicase family protein [Ralstonia pseudosolanacearum]
MFDFGKLAKSKTATMPTSHVELFDNLDRKATHQILRPVQAEALQALDAQQGRKDVVLKVSTGSGKTLVGLVYAEMMRRRYAGEPVLYLCPTIQLVDQVLETAAKIGVSAEKFRSEVQPHQAIDGKSILVCTYDKLFTARNVFERHSWSPSAIVLDDVHSGVERVRQKYTVSIPNDIYRQIREIFEPISTQCDPALWRGINNNESDARVEIPYWHWLPQAEAISALIEEYRDEDEVQFSWPNISRYAELARLCISGTAAELSLVVPAIEENRAYSAAKHRLFMSASIKDGSSLVRDMECDAAARAHVIQPASDKGAGERMILPIALVDPKVRKEDIAALCSALSQKTNVVVLTSSYAQAQIWVDAGARIAKGADVDLAVQDLRASSSGQFVVFTQRFDGVDLPDDACRVLVVDGVPTGDRLCDRIDYDRQKNSPGNNMRVVNRLEQALGRAVRSSADFAATLLVGTDLAAFIGRKDVKQLLEPHTAEQIELGKDLAEQIKGAGMPTLMAISQAVHLLLDRDERWKEAHRDRMANMKRPAATGAEHTPSEAAAKAERNAWLQAKARNHQAAVAALQPAVDDARLDLIQKAELTFRMAGYMHHFDPAKAAALYRGAFTINSKLPRPPQLPDRRYQKVREQASAIREYMSAFANVGGALAKLEEIRAKVAYAGAAPLVEEGLFELGVYLGAESSRPEKETGRGPDVLWQFDDLSFCIEAKNEKTAPIYKADAEQLLLSTQWCVDENKIEGSRLVAVFATNSRAVDRKEDVSFGPRLLDEACVMSLIDALAALATQLVFDGPLFTDVTRINKAIHDLGLTGSEVARRLPVLSM